MLKEFFDKEAFETEVLTALTKKLQNGIRSWKSNQANEVAASIVYDHSDIIEKYCDEMTAEEIADKLIWFERDYLDKSKEPWGSRNESSQLKEAIKTLQNAGLIVEDTETHDDDYREVDDALNDPKQLKKMSLRQVADLNQKRHDIHFQHSELDVKIKHAKLVNLKNELEEMAMSEMFENIPFDVTFRTYDYNELLIVDFGENGEVEIHVDPEDGWFHVMGELYGKKEDKSVGRTGESVIYYLKHQVREGEYQRNKRWRH